MHCADFRGANAVGVVIAEMRADVVDDIGDLRIAEFRVVKTSARR